MGRQSTWPMLIQPKATKPNWASGWRKNSTKKRKAPYPSRNSPITFPRALGLAE